MSDPAANRDVAASRRQARRLAITLGLLALALYVGFIAMTVLRAQH